MPPWGRVREVAKRQRVMCCSMVRELGSMPQTPYDAGHPEEVFCHEITIGESEVTFSDIHHMCWGSDGVFKLDLRRLEEIRWHVVSDLGQPYSVSEFCVEEIALF